MIYNNHIIFNLVSLTLTRKFILKIFIGKKNKPAIEVIDGERKKLYTTFPL